VIGGTEMAAALVMEAIESLDPENVTGETLRDAVVDVLVRAQMMPGSRHDRGVVMSSSYRKGV
jgi:hypothetical protein